MSEELMGGYPIDRSGEKPEPKRPDLLEAAQTVVDALDGKNWMGTVAQHKVLTAAIAFEKERREAVKELMRSSARLATWSGDETVTRRQAEHDVEVAVYKLRALGYE